MKNTFTLFFLLFGLAAWAQTFPYKPELKAPLTAADKNELKFIAEKAYLYGGNLSFNVAEIDLNAKPYSPDSTYFTLDQGLALYDKQLLNAGANDSIDILYKQYQLLNQKADREGALEKVKVAYTILRRLLDNEEFVSPQTFQQAGYFAYWINGDMNQAFPFYASAFAGDPTDSIALGQMINMFYVNRMFYQADSLIALSEKQFPNSLMPHLFRMQIESILLYDTMNANQDNVMKKCLREVTQIGFIDTLRLPSQTEKRVLLSYLLEEYLLVMKYNMNVAADTLIPMAGCDKESLKNMREAYEKAHKKNKEIPAYTTSNALAWTYALEQDYSKSIQYLKQAIHEINKLGGSYLNTRTSLYNSLLAFQFLNKDTLGAIKTTEKLIAGHDSTGYNPDDYLMLSVLQLKTKRYDKSIQSCEQAKKLYGNESTVCRILALDYYYTGQKTQAFAQLKKSVSADKENFMNYAVYGIVLLLDGQISQAAQYLEAAWYIDNTDADLNQILQRHFARKE